MKTTSEAPRLRASMPTAPVPAKTSRKREPAMLGPSTLKRVSRSLSLVGRKAEPFRDFRRRLRYWPAITRMGTVVSYQFSVFSQAGRRKRTGRACRLRDYLVGYGYGVKARQDRRTPKLAYFG